MTTQPGIPRLRSGQAFGERPWRRETSFILGARLLAPLEMTGKCLRLLAPTACINTALCPGAGNITSGKGISTHPARRDGDGRAVMHGGVCCGDQCTVTAPFTTPLFQPNHNTHELRRQRSGLEDAEERGLSKLAAPYKPWAIARDGEAKCAFRAVQAVGRGLLLWRDGA